jgi:HSP20 family protein
MVIRFRSNYNDLFGQYDDLRREIDRAFNEAGLGRRGRPFSRASFLPGRQARGYPLVNLSEDRDAIYAEALAPGVDPATLDVSVMRDRLTISGEKISGASGVKQEDFHRNEREAGKFVRTIRLATEVDADKVRADYKNGLLKIVLPKAEEAKPKQIAVSTV